MGKVLEVFSPPFCVTVVTCPCKVQMCIKLRPCTMPPSLTVPVPRVCITGNVSVFYTRNVFRTSSNASMGVHHLQVMGAYLWQALMFYTLALCLY
jgi:hypothetical protein